MESVGIPQRLLGNTPEMALRDAMRWIADWAGFDAKGRARRDAEGAMRMGPELRRVADEVARLLGDEAVSTWRDETRASWSVVDLDFFVSQSGDEIALTTYRAGLAKGRLPAEAVYVNEGRGSAHRQTIRRQIGAKANPSRGHARSGETSHQKDCAAPALFASPGSVFSSTSGGAFPPLAIQGCAAKVTGNGSIAFPYRSNFDLSFVNITAKTANAVMLTIGGTDFVKSGPSRPVR